MRPTRSAARAAARGLVAAMAMTGARVVTTGTGLVDRTPPDAIIDQAGPTGLSGLSADQRAVVKELAHWAYGALGGAAYGMMGRRVRASVWSGPLWGVTLWLFFELVLAPVLSLDYARERRVAWRSMVILDHLLYGVVVAGRLASEPANLPKRSFADFRCRSSR